MALRLAVSFALALLSGCIFEDGDPYCDPGFMLFPPDEPTQCIPIGSDGGADGGVDNADATPDGDTTSDAGPCGECSGETPVCDASTSTCVACLGDDDCGNTTPACDTETNTCVACTTNDQCTGEASLCDTETNVCVGCLSNTDCTSPEASVCDEGVCTGCTSDLDCNGITAAGGRELGACHDSTCVECTPATEAARCGETACDPVTFECTETRRGTLEPCESCLSDSECQENHFCVPTNFEGVETGHYCLGLWSLGCEQPFTSRLRDRGSRSNEASTDYCGIDETATTCDAVRALTADNQVCSNTEGELPPCPTGGTCQDLNVRVMGEPVLNCSYPCSASNQCPGGFSCGSSGGPTFCGGGD